MKNLKNILFVALGAFALTSCNDFLDKNPDQRATIDTKKKVQLLLVTAYDVPNYGPLGELCSDNIVDNNTPDASGHVNTKPPYKQMQNELFKWEAVTSDQQQDSPYYIWSNCYMNIAVANQALDAIAKLEADGINCSAEKGEALIVRAYNHFLLANVFCQAYKNDEASKADLGVYYMTKAETAVKPTYERGNVTELYQHIQADLEEGLKYVSDEYYSVPKYHFNAAAAHAFAARFYLFKRDYDKVIEHANKVLGTTQADALACQWDAATAKEVGNIEQEMYKWIDASSPANLLILTTNSPALYYFIPDYGRYTFNRYPRDYTVNTSNTGGGPCWSGNFPGANIWRYDANYGGFFAKLYIVFEYTDKVAGIGYVHTMRREFTTGETLLCRAEAEAMKGDLTACQQDLNTWAKAYNCETELTDTKIKNFFYKGKGGNAGKQECPTLHCSDMSSDWQVSDDKLPYLWCCLHFRRIETLHDGMRWFDIKRYGIEVTHEIGYPVETYTLAWNDARRAIQLPQEAILAGQEANPGFETVKNEAFSIPATYDKKLY